MADLIDRSKLLDTLRKSHEYHAETARDFSLLYRDIRLVEEQQAVDAVEVVRCRACVHAVEIEKDYVRKLFVDGTKQCELGRADTVFGYSIISNDGFCDSGERKEDV